MIFENSSPKGILRRIMSNVPKQSLLQDSQCSQAGALKALFCERSQRETDGPVCARGTREQGWSSTNVSSLGRTCHKKLLMLTLHQYHRHSQKLWS